MTDDDSSVDDTPITDDDSSVNNTPTVRCSRCDREWDLGYELDVRRAGNAAVEQFALDHERHTGHFPDEVTPWIADCRHCPDEDRYLSERPARRWAETHARHTGHEVELSHGSEESGLIDPDDHQ